MEKSIIIFDYIFWSWIGIFNVNQVEKNAKQFESSQLNKLQISFVAKGIYETSKLNLNYKRGKKQEQSAFTWRAVYTILKT